jgi:glucose uptake protein
MILPESYLPALLVMILSMVCWGSWANTYKLSGKWRFELYYFDYALGLLLMAILLAYTLGSLGFDGFTFSDDLMHAGKRQWLFGFLGGVVFNLANMLLMAAIAVAGMAVAFPVGIGVALLVGVILNYMIKPAGNATLLFSGCALVLAAIIVDAVAYRMLNMLRYEALAKAGKTPSVRRTVSIKGIVISLVCGLLMGSFFPLVAKAQETDVGLGPYAVAVVFAAGVFLSTFVFNLFFMNLPVEGEPVELRDYFIGTPKQHLLGLLGGAIWCGGGVAAFVAASTPQVGVGPAISYAMGQGSTLISALWGLLVWKEFKGSNLQIKLLLTIMLVLFACGLALISVAPLYGVHAP